MDNVCNTVESQWVKANQRSNERKNEKNEGVKITSRTIYYVQS